MSTSRFLTGCCEEKISSRGKRGKFALASGEEANIREKARRSTVRRTTTIVL